MKFVVFGLSVSSSWGNAHASIWRGLCRALSQLGHHVVFFERDLPYYAAHRDQEQPEGCELVLYHHWIDVLPTATRELATADVGLITSYCPDATLAEGALFSSRPRVRAFYDLDTQVTLDRLAAHRAVDYLGPRGLRDYDLVFSLTGGRALDAMRQLLGAKRVVPLYASVDPAVHRPTRHTNAYVGDLSYLGIYAGDRQVALEELFLRPADRLPDRRFILGGSLYPSDFPWRPNVWYARNVAPPEHPSFFCSSPWTLNLTRRAMGVFGFCPSPRLFEAAACGVPILSDSWEGLDQFFAPGKEIVVARNADEVVEALAMPVSRRAGIAAAARARTLLDHTAAARALELLDHVHRCGR